VLNELTTMTGIKQYISFALALLLLLSCLTSRTFAAKVSVTSNPSASTEDDGNNEKSDCRWGEHCDTNSSHHHQDATANHLPFVKMTQHAPPEGFLLSARVYTDPADKLAHFDDETPLILYYYECASRGTTTAPLKLQHGYFRHTFSSSPHVYQGAEFGNHPTLMVTLSETVVELNSGESRTFPSGSVLLLEDVLAGGHKCKAKTGSEVTVMLLTLPQSLIFVGKENTALYKACEQDDRAGMSTKLRRSVLAAIGTALSLVLADWLGKVAPIWLSVGIGGGCLVVGTTWGFVVGAENVVDQIELWRERRRLQVDQDSVDRYASDVDKDSEIK
jgi:hypothetical protein